MSSQYSKYEIHFECSALDPDALVVLHMRGREEISRPFVFDLYVSPRGGAPLVPEDFDAIMGGTAHLAFGPDHEHPVRGVVREIELTPTYDIEHATYRMRLVPRLWDTQLTRGSWIYQEKTPPEIISAALSEILPAPMAEGDDFELSLEGSYNPREYVVQYEESIFNFISRQAEHWGIFYFFDHLGEKDRVVFGDTNGAFPQLADFETIDCVQVDAADPREVVRSISAVQRMVTNRVSLRDYNYRTPSVALVTPTQTVDSAGVGDVHISGEHFWTPAEGAAIATVRSQERFSHKLRMQAQSRVRGLRAGHRFTLAGGTPEVLGLARDYLVVAVEHEYAHNGLDSQPVPYRNRLALLPYEAVFRPDVITPRPRIHGIMHAKIDSEAGDDEVNVPVDEWGRYKVVMPFDVAGQTGGKATCWIRLATPAGGGAWGMALQLHVGIEVAIYHVDGDPDRPVIASSLPNFENRSTITAHNPNQNVISSRKGVSLTFSDS